MATVLRLFAWNLCLVFVAPALFAQQDYWIPSFEGLPPGPVQALEVNHHGVVLAGTRGGVYRLHPQSGWVLTQIQHTAVSLLSSSSSGTFYAILERDSTLARSDDGVFWTTSPLPGMVYQNFIPVTDSLLFAYIQGNETCDPEQSGLIWHRSEDAGRTWRCLADTFPFTEARDLHLTQQQTLLASTQTGIYRSEDNGQTWAQVFEVDSNTFGGEGQGVVLVNSWDEDIYRSTDDGQSWTLTSLTGSVGHLAGMPDGTVFAGLLSYRRLKGGEGWRYFDGGIRRSDDQGATWSQTGFADEGIHGLITRNARLYAATDVGLLQSSDASTTWPAFDDGLHNQWVIDLATAPAGTAYASTYPRALHRSSDDGAHWEPVQVPPFDSDLIDYGSSNRIATPRFWNVNVAQDGTIYAVDGNLLRSNDGGHSWATLPVGFLLQDLFLQPDGSLLAAGFAEGVFKSTDQGTSWSKVGDGDIHAEAVAAGPDGTVYAGDLFSIYYLNPGVTTWTHVPVEGIKVLDLAVDQQGRVYASGREYIEVADKAASSQPTTTVTNGYDPLFFSDREPLHALQQPVYQGTNAGGMLRSDDQGQTWQRIGPDSVAIRTLAIDENGRLFAGPYTSDDAGETWTFVGHGMHSMDLTALAINANGYLFAGTNGSGLYRSTFFTALPSRDRPALATTMLGPVFPNPVQHEVATIPFTLSTSTHVTLTVYDGLGRKLSTLQSAHRPAGHHEVYWNTTQMVSGLYWVHFQSAYTSSTTSVIIVR